MEERKCGCGMDVSPATLQPMTQPVGYPTMVQPAGYPMTMQPGAYPTMTQPMPYPMCQPTAPMVMPTAMPTPMPTAPMSPVTAPVAYPSSHCYGMPMPMPTPTPTQDVEDVMVKEMDTMMKMYPEVCKRMHIYVVSECDRMDYEGSPIYADVMDKAVVDQMVDHMYERATKEMPELMVVEKREDAERQYIPRAALVRGLLGSLVLTELFGRRRPIYRRRIGYSPYTYYGYPYGGFGGYSGYGYGAPPYFY
jgi:hypothetical protein